MTDPNRRTFLVQSVGALVGMALLPDIAELGAAVPVRPGREPYRVGLVGVGRQGRAILDELAKIDAVEVAAVCDVVPSRVIAGIERAHGAEAFTDHREMLERRPDIAAVIIATPTHLHRQVALDAIAAGRHVYCEAPLASTIEDCEAIVEAAAGASTVFHVGFTARSNPIYKRARTVVRSDSVRDLVSLYAQHHRKTTWRFPTPSGGNERATNWRLDPEVSIGLAGELGSHAFDVMHWFRGRAPRTIRGSGSIRLHHDGRRIPDTVRVEMVWDDGVALQYQATLANSYGGEYQVLYGTNAAVRLASTHGWLFKESDAATQGWEVYATRQKFHDSEGIVLVADATKLAAQGRLQDGAGLEHPPLYYALVDFVKSFAEGAPVACTAQDGMRATVLGILANRAVMTGETINAD
ncbi:MAG TPA: Gfo/Idh/MocA family oxidoreductase [Longimicrobiales bacterium]|nr:Gfo/Idh/MocA family oxidoreductase [Longimicrobiales bacterium]